MLRQKLNNREAGDLRNRFASASIRIPAPKDWAVISMTDEVSPQEIQQIRGALDVLFTLREEFAQWAEEAQDDSKQEALDNVLAHIENIEIEYKQRLHDATRK